MAITSTDRKVQYDISSSVPATFAIPFKYWATNEIYVVLTSPTGDTTLTEDTDYTVSAAGDSGTLTRVGTWDATATLVTIYRELPQTQDTVLANGGVQNAETYMQMVDRAVAMNQEAREILDRLVRFPITDTTTIADMPNASTRAGKYLGFDASTGDPIAISAAVGSTTVSPYMATMLDDADALAAQKTLALLASGATAEIASFVQTFLGSADFLELQKNAGLLPSGASAAITTAVKNLLNTAEAQYLTYSGSSVGVNASTVQAAIENVAGATLKDFITNAGFTYDATDLTALFKSAVVRYRFEIGDVFTSVLDREPSATFPALKLWEANQTISETNWPLLVTDLRAEKMKSWSGSAYATNHTVTVSSSTLTGSGTAWDNALAALAEDQTIEGTYVDWRTVNIAGTDYAITNVNAAAHTVTVSGTPSSGTQTAIFYLFRIAGSTTTARLFQWSGRALMSPDGTLRIAGTRRRHHFQGHKHNLSLYYNTSGGSQYYPGPGGNYTTSPATIPITNPITDGANGTPITGPETEPNSASVYLYLWGGRYVP